MEKNKWKMKNEKQQIYMWAVDKFSVNQKCTAILIFEDCKNLISCIQTKNQTICIAFLINATDYIWESSLRCTLSEIIAQISRYANFFLND